MNTLSNFANIDVRGLEAVLLTTTGDQRVLIVCAVLAVIVSAGIVKLAYGRRHDR